MEGQLEQLRKVSDYLGLHLYTEKIVRMQQALDKKEYLLTVMGQFSAGKSHLINNLIGKTILPVHITETTAILTFIQYGESEYVCLHYNDGSIKEVSIEDSLKLWQSGEESSQLANLEKIDIYVDSELLKNGLVIVDTPGVNTIMERHIALAVDMIESADRVLYVMGKAVTEMDLNYIDRILNSGVQIIFVRTHMDEIKVCEEDIATTIFNEKALLAQYTNEDSYFVSNNKNNDYYNYISDLRKYLTQNLAKNVEQALCTSIEERMLLIAQQLKVELSNRSTSIACILSNNKEGYLQRKTEIENALNEMEKILKKNKDRLVKKIENTKQEAMERLDYLEPTAIKETQKKVEGLEYNVDVEKYAEHVNAILKAKCIFLQTAFLKQFDNMLKDNKKELNESFSKLEYCIPMDCDIPEDLNEAGEKTQEIIERINLLNILKNQLNEELIHIQEEQVTMQTGEKTLEYEQQELKEALEQVQEELRNYPEYEAKYCVVQEATHNGENAWRTAGKLADIATILIPAKGWATVIEKTLNWGSKGAKAIKATQTAAKLAGAAKKVEEGSKALKVVDTVTDALRMAAPWLVKESKKNKIKKQKIEDAVKKYQNFKGKINEMRGEDEEQTSILDYLTIEYYFAKIGKKFDKPQVQQIDYQYEEQYHREKKEIEQRLQKQALEEFQKRQELLDIQDKQEQLKLKNEITLKKQKDAELEEAELKKQLNNAKYRDKEKAIKDYYYTFSADKISEFCNYLRHDKFAEIEKNLEAYKENYDFNICININRKRKELEELTIQYNSSDRENLQKEAEICSDYQQFLETITG